MIIKTTHPLREPDNNDGSGGSTLSSDQQKIAAAVTKAAETAPPEVNKPVGPARPKVVRSVITEPPAKALEGEFSSEGLPDGDAVGEPASDKKADDAKIAADKKVADDKKAKETQQQQQKADDNKGQIRVGEQKPALRDSVATILKELGHSDEEIAALKQMSNPALELVAKATKEVKELRSKKPESFLQHPNAFILQPEFEQAATMSQRAEYESNHWKQQLLAIRAGKSWQTIKGYTKDGEPVLDGPFKATDEAEVDVQNAYQHAVGVTQQQKATLQQLQNSFAARVKEDADATQAELAKRFEWVSDPTKLDTKIEIEGLGEVPLRKIISDFKSLFPAYQHNNLMLDVASHMFVALQVQGKQLREALAEAGLQKKLKKDVLTAEPPMDGGEGGKGGKTKDDMVFDTEGMD